MTGSANPANSSRSAELAPIAVTGAAGFIGSHVVEELLRSGHSVRAFVRYSSSGTLGLLGESAAAMESIQNGSLTIVRGDITAVETVRELMDGASVVLHLAALIGIPYSYVTPSHYVLTNIVGTMNVLDVARAMGMSRVVLTSTSETLGSAQSDKMDERHPLVAQSPYAATKIAADKLGEAYFRSFDTPITTLRPFNTFGPRQSRRAVIPTIISQLLHGEDVRIGSTAISRDFMYVRDTARAFRLAATTPSIEGRTIHVGTGAAVTIADVIQSVGRLLDRTPRVIVESDRVRPEVSEVSRLVCDNALARSLLGFEPEWTLERGLSDTIASWRDAPLAGAGGDGYVV